MQKADVERILRGGAANSPLRECLRHDTQSFAGETRRNSQAEESVKFSGDNYRAFTLAEVLITLGIIGVVAALTLPTLIQNYQKKSTITKLKQTYSMLSQAIKLSEVDNGEASSWDFGEASCEGASQFTEKYITPYLKVDKKCICDETNDCKIKASPLNNLEITNGLEYFTRNSEKLFLSNGSMIIISRAPNSDFPIFIIDINGPQNPNIIGKDIFEYEIIDGKFITRGNMFDYETLKTNPYGCYKDKTGEYCSRLIMLDNWEISDRYPW